MLRPRPASCSARENREKAFRNLYELAQRAFGQTPRQVDEQHRILDDYVFAELVYTQSKTCCWNSTTAARPRPSSIVLDLIESGRRAEAAEFMRRHLDVVRNLKVAQGKKARESKDARSEAP